MSYCTLCIHSESSHLFVTEDTVNSLRIFLGLFLAQFFIAFCKNGRKGHFYQSSLCSLHQIKHKPFGSAATDS